LEDLAFIQSYVAKVFYGGSRVYTKYFLIINKTFFGESRTYTKYFTHV